MCCRERGCNETMVLCGLTDFIEVVRMFGNSEGDNSTTNSEATAANQPIEQ